MNYSNEMLLSMKEVAKTRRERLKEVMPILSATEKEELLKSFHPDYKPETTRKIKVGVNKGEIATNEIADLIEAYSYLDPEKFKISEISHTCDVLVIGGGGAGAMAALSAFDAGADVILATKLRLGDSNTVMAQGGIQAADKPNDSPAIHYLDVMGGGGYKNIPELVYQLVNTAPSIIAWLEARGMMFDKKDDGTMITIHGGGTSRKRMHTAKDYTGMEIMRILKDEVLNKGIKIIEYVAAIELLSQDGSCCGAVFVNLETGEKVTIQAKVTILATGGAGRLHIQGFPTSNHYGATADGLVLANRIGARLIYIDTIQYHPTGVAFPEQISGQLITEKVRGLGAQLVNREGKQFIYELETRDCVASAIIRECIERKHGVKTPQGGVGVWLDTPLIEIKNGPGTIEKELPAMFRQFSRFGIDIRQEPILTYPTQHYQNGGVLINSDGETNIKNLLACGEVSGGVHGRNRLMGNSLLDILVFGQRAGRRAASLARETKLSQPTLNHLIAYHQELKAAGIPENRRSPLILPDYRRPELKTKLPWS